MRRTIPSRKNKESPIKTCYACEKPITDLHFADYHENMFFCSELCVQETDPEKYRPVSVGDMFENADEIAFEEDVRKMRAILKDDPYYAFSNNHVSYYSFGEGYPWDQWVIIAQINDLFFVVPWTGIEKQEFKCLMLPHPISVHYHWEKSHLNSKETYSGIDISHLEGKQGPVNALVGFGQWRTAEELNCLRDMRLRRLEDGEADKAYQGLSDIITGVLTEASEV